MTVTFFKRSAIAPSRVSSDAGAHCDEPSRPTSSGATFWLTYWLAIALVITKATHFGMPTTWSAIGLWHYTRQLLVATAADIAFSLCLGMIAALSLAALPRKSRGRQIVWVTWVALFTACVIFSIVAAYVFVFVRSPITRTVLRAAGEWSDFRSSFMTFVHTGSMMALVAGLLGYPLLVWLSHRFVGLPRRRILWPVIALLIVAAGAQYSYAQSERKEWSRRFDHRICLSPHWELFSTGVLRIDEQFQFPTEFPKEYDAEFVPLRDRASSSPPRQLPSHPKHVIVYVLESTGTQFFHLYGSPAMTTPSLDAEASSALVVNNCYCNVGVTSSAMVAITSSDFPRMFWQLNLNDSEHWLNQPGILLGQVLKQNGFRTLALTSSDFNWACQSEFLKGRGFDQMLDKRQIAGEDVVSWGKSDRGVVDALLNWIDSDPKHTTPFYALCWTNQTHHPYAMTTGVEEVNLLGTMEAPPGIDRITVNRYLNVLREEDRNLGLLFAGLRKRGLADDTLVVVTGDHGEGFDWHHPGLSHGYRLFEEFVHVPCVFWNPKLFANSPRNDKPCAHIDLNPTIVDILGLPPAGTWQGHSLFRADHTGRAYYAGAMDDVLIGVRQGDWKYTFNASTGFDELYNIREDPHEAHEISIAHPELCTELRQRVCAWASHQNREGPGVKP